MSSTLIDDKEIKYNTTQTKRKELRMKNIIFKLNLKFKWIVVLSFLISLGMCGVCPAQPYESFA